MIFLSENTTWNTSIIILRSCFICLNNTQCITNVIEGTYSAQFYLIENDGHISTNGSHRIIQNILINNYVTNIPTISATTTMPIGKLDIMKVCMYKVDVLVFAGNTTGNQVYTTVQFPSIVNTRSDNHLVIIGGMYI